MLITYSVNGTTAGFFVKLVGLASSSPTKQGVFIGYLKQFLDQIKNFEQELKVQPYLCAVDWYYPYT